MALGEIVSGLKGIYDRLIAVAVLIVLIGSLAYLAWHVGTVQTAQEHFMREINAIRPAHPEAQPIDVTPFESALDSILHPHQIPLGQDGPSMWVPGTRVQCIDCRRPIPIEADACPFCHAQQPIDPADDPDRDLDNDGIKDIWELKYGLNPRNPVDAQRDSDGDGFTNLEEFFASPQTDPTNREDSPSIAMKLCVKSLVADPFNLRFKSVIRLPGKDNRQFAINTRGNAKTYFKKLGEEVEGFVVDSFEPKFKREEKFGQAMQIDISVLTLKRGKKLIPLTKGRGVEYQEYTCTLLFTVDNSTYALRLNKEFDLQGKRYKLIEIDSNGGRVVIKRLSDGTELQIRKCAEDDDSEANAPVSSFPLEQGVEPQ